MATVSSVLAWRTDSLAEAAWHFATARDRVEESGYGVQGVCEELPEVWEGDAGQVARAALSEKLAAAADLAEALGLVARTLSAAGEALDAAQRVVLRARDLAEDEGLVLNKDGGVRQPAPSLLLAGTVEDPAVVARRNRQVEAAVDAQRLARQGLAAAQEADDDAARAVRDAWQIAVWERGPDIGSDLVAAVLDRAVPAADAAPELVAAWWETLSPAAREALELREWARLGNLDGIPYEVRIRANRVAISAALEEELRRAPGLEKRVAELEEQLAEILASGDRARQQGGESVARDLERARADLAECESLGRWYQELLTGVTRIEYPDKTELVQTGHQVVLFDPAGGRFAEVIGDLSVATSVGVYVPGTGSAFGPDRGRYDRAADFVSGANPAQSLAMVTFLGGPMPQSAAGDAPYNH